MRIKGSFKQDWRGFSFNLVLVRFSGFLELWILGASFLENFVIVKFAKGSAFSSVGFDTF